MIKNYWMGCIIMGISFAVFFANSDQMPFVVGQVVMGFIGLYREFYLFKNGVKI